MRSRGAGGEGVAALAVMEGALLAVPAAILAPWVAVFGLRALNHVGPLAQIGLELDPHVTTTSYVLAALAALLCVAALALPALRSGAVTSTVAGRGRPQPKSFVQRAGLDLILVAVALIAYWQLRRYGGPVVESVQGRLGIDPLLIAAPALGLLAGAVLALRVVPAAASLVERVASSARGMVAALGTRELARRPAAVRALGAPSDARARDRPLRLCLQPHLARVPARPGRLRSRRGRARRAERALGVDPRAPASRCLREPGRRALRAPRLPRVARPVGFVGARDPARDRCGSDGRGGQLSRRPGEPPARRDARSPRREPAASRPGPATRPAHAARARRRRGGRPSAGGSRILRDRCAAFALRRDQGRRRASSTACPRPASGSRARGSASSTTSRGPRGEAPRYPLSLVGVETNVIPSFRVNRPVSVDVHSVEVGDGSGTFTSDRPTGSAVAGELEPDRGRRPALPRRSCELRRLLLSRRPLGLGVHVPESRLGHVHRFARPQRAGAGDPRDRHEPLPRRHGHRRRRPRSARP